MNITSLPRPTPRLVGSLLIFTALMLSTACAEIAGLAPYRGIECYLNPGKIDVSSSTAALHRYTYTVDCGDGLVSEAHVAYDVATGIAQEDVISSGGQRVRAKWSCVRDPWIRAETDTFRCTRQSALFDGDSPLLDVAKDYVPPYPYSAWYLRDWQRGTLASRLKNTLSAKPSTTPPAPPPPPSAKLPTADQAGRIVAGRTTATPTNFQARRHPNGLAILLTWTDNATGEGYYEIRAFNHLSGKPAFRLTVPADSTQYIDVESTSQVGGVDYELRACYGAECGAPAKATFGA